ncbi:MAG: thiamine pyrophosphate-requiring protein, partial [Chloroflexota bacterium]|nr:thiamine pyrophosphate-requiring protein [Chloroflexota bacterium]
IVVDRPEDVGPAWDRALTSDRPVVIDAIVDANVPTIPPDPSQQVINKITQALAKEEDAELVKRQLAREGVEV